MDIIDARLLLKALVRSRSLLRHSLMMGYIMREIALLLDEEPDEWEICGMLHDIDLPQAVLNYEYHGIISSEILRNEGVNERIINAITHHEREKEREEPMEIVLYLLEKVLKISPDIQSLQNFLRSVGKKFLEQLDVEEEDFVEAVRRGMNLFLEDYKEGGMEDEV